MNTTLRKKKEYNIKFVFVKAIKYLKSKFLSEQFNFEKSKSFINSNILHNSDICFYRYFFGEIAREKGIPIENFFVFKNWTHRYDKNIPKTITMRSIQLWKLNPEFIFEIRKYFRESFLNDFKIFNQTKISKMEKEWIKLVKKFGPSIAVKSILKTLSAKGSKLPWTLSEVKNGLKICDQVLN